ncbi:CidA/LrgA family protein [Nocardioides jiangxiensis]|uniref:CidA/LrgA family protein n=1 Tax=Nocardioides jiangxiensis TaxID=3064524 RepID=A0ABT9B1C0_9ACTN|nr:CidA/LrgA family protein [Nocardioides sp. WY-20]MDO7868654.1 CidA/LrgA family protein [Nocardioides sp. WY-20]
MINGLLWLLGFQLVGEVVVRSLHLAVPGPVVGMVLLFAVLQWRRPPAGANLFRAADGLLKHLQLLFIPAGVGVITLLHVVGDHPVPIVGALVVSWIAVLLVVGWLTQLLLGRDAGAARR